MVFSFAFIDGEEMKKAMGYSDSGEREKRFRQEYMAWQGTRHRLGGTGREGI